MDSSESLEAGTCFPWQFKCLKRVQLEPGLKRAGELPLGKVGIVSCPWEDTDSSGAGLVLLPAGAELSLTFVFLFQIQDRQE